MHWVGTDKANETRKMTMKRVLTTMLALPACFYNPNGSEPAATGGQATTSTDPSMISEPTTALSVTGSVSGGDTSTSSNTPEDSSESGSTGSDVPVVSFGCDSTCGQPFVATADSPGLCGLYTDPSRDEIQVLGYFSGDLNINGKPIDMTVSPHSFVARFGSNGAPIEPSGTSISSFSDCRASATLTDHRILVAAGSCDLITFSSPGEWLTIDSLCTVGALTTRGNTFAAVAGKNGATKC